MTKPMEAEPTLRKIVDELNAKAENLYRQDGFQQALELSEQTYALSCGGNLKNPIYTMGMVHSLIYMAMCKTNTGPLFREIETLKTAIHHLNVNDDPRLRCTAYTALGYVYQMHGDYATSRSYTQRAIVNAEANNFLYELADALVTHASSLLISGEVDEAHQLLTKSYNIAHALKNARLESGVLNDLAMVSANRGKLKLAEAQARDAYHLAPSPTLKAMYLDTLANITDLKGDPSQAVEMYRESIALDEQAHKSIHCIESYNNLGALYLRLQRYPEAETTLLAGLKRASENGVLRFSSQAHKLLADLYDQTGEVAKAYTHFKAFHEQKEKLHTPESFGNLMNQMIAHKLDTMRKDMLPGKASTRRAGSADRSDDLEFLTATDPLTGLVSPAQFYELGAKTFTNAVQTRKPLSVIVFNIDDLKTINKRHGQLIGDRVLVTMAELLISSIRMGDQCARFFNDEFVVLLQNTEPFTAEHIAQRIRSTSRNLSVRSDDGPITFSTKYVISALQPDDTSLQDLISRALGGKPQ